MKFKATVLLAFIFTLSLIALCISCEETGMTMEHHHSRNILQSTTNTVNVTEKTLGDFFLVNSLIIAVALIFICCVANVVIRPCISGEVLDRQFFVVRDAGMATRFYAIYIMILGGINIIGAGTLFTNVILYILEKDYGNTVDSVVFWSLVSHFNGCFAGFITGFSCILCGLFIADSDEPITILFSGIFSILGNIVASILASIFPLILGSQITSFMHTIFLAIGIGLYLLVALINCCVGPVWFFAIFDVKESLKENFIETF
mmetsp:Transcript_363/g.656  ORF Transcript_363/g.656 Transcript_363/m.656 type:complete len:261 (+) Transcript_363:157-939(+)